MNCLQLLILFYLLVLSENAVIDSKNDNVTQKDQKDNNSLCQKEKCIMKCCPHGEVVRRKKKINALCAPYEVVRNINDYNEDSKTIFLQNPDLTTFDVKDGIFEANETFKNNAQILLAESFFNKYITDQGVLKLEVPNAYDRWRYIPNDMYCWDYTRTGNDSLLPGVWVMFQENEVKNRTSMAFMTSAMLITCFFLLLVLVVYGLLPELRNLCGKILMAYVASLLLAFLMLAILRMDDFVSGVCLRLSLCIYFFFLASFCWMNVMSFDIWWTFRGYAKARPIHRRGDNFKFLMYCLYAWGVPLIMTIGLEILNSLDLRYMPSFVTPKLATENNMCFFGADEKLLYLYMPMLILILCNWAFYIMTAYNIWRLSRGTAVLDSAAAGTPQAHRNNRSRFLVYLKLSVVMGLNWILEVASYNNPDSSLWFISDFYNIFIGILIFLIFVCKKKILRKLKAVCMKCKTKQWQPEQTNSTKGTSTSDNNASLETITINTFQNPKGSSCHDNLQ